MRTSFWWYLNRKLLPKSLQEMTDLLSLWIHDREKNFVEHLIWKYFVFPGCTFWNVNHFRKWVHVIPCNQQYLQLLAYTDGIMQSIHLQIYILHGKESSRHNTIPRQRSWVGAYWTSLTYEYLLAHDNRRNLIPVNWPISRNATRKETLLKETRTSTAWIVRVGFSKGQSHKDARASPWWL